MKKPKKPRRKTKRPPLKVVYIPMSAWTILPKAEPPRPELSLD